MLCFEEQMFYWSSEDLGSGRARYLRRGRSSRDGDAAANGGLLGDGPLATAEKLMEDVLKLLQATVPVASTAVRKALRDSDGDTQKLSESIVNPSSAPGFSQGGYPSGRPFSRAPTVKSEYYGRDCKFRFLY